MGLQRFSRTLREIAERYASDAESIVGSNCPTRLVGLFRLIISVEIAKSKVSTSNLNNGRLGHVKVAIGSVFTLGKVI